MKKILVIGATSAIATACSKLWANDKAELFLVGRTETKLQQTADDLMVHGASKVHTHILDLNDLHKQADMLDSSFEKLKQIDVVLVAHGTLPDQSACEQDVDLSMREFTSNGLNVISLLTLLANKMQAQGKGTIAVISSVAGDRGRPTNYLYGSAKAAVSTFCEGLRARLFKQGVHVLTIKPGFVDTPMTKDLDLPKALVVSPDVVANAIHHAINKKSNVAYTPWFWLIIMIIIKSIPIAIFKKLNL